MLNFRVKDKDKNNKLKTLKSTELNVLPVYDERYRKVQNKNIW